VEGGQRFEPRLLVVCSRQKLERAKRVNSISRQSCEPVLAPDLGAYTGRQEVQERPLLKFKFVHSQEPDGLANNMDDSNTTTITVVCDMITGSFELGHDLIPNRFNMMSVALEVDAV
jgi:hypothetical protein